MHSSGNNGQLWRALAISLAAHVLLLWPDAPRRLPERAAGAIEATLRPMVEAAAPAPGPAAVAESAPTPQRPRTPAATAPAAVPPAPTLSMPSPLAGNDSTGGVAERSAPVAVISPAATAVAAPGEGAGFDADGLRQYRLELAREARRYKRYPERALLAGIGGTVEVRVEHDPRAVPVARLVRSSGHDLLDAAALEMMRQAAPRTAVPEPLRGRAFAVSLPVIFNAGEE